MLLVGNLINALGGQPKVDDPGFPMAYPGDLPGALAGGLDVPLRRFSPELARDVLMKIEEPETPLNFPVGFDADAGPRTIGQFYTLIKQRIETDPSLTFAGGKQLTTFASFGLPKPAQIIDGAAKAVAAIDLIMRQGEGTTESPADSSVADLAHYYRLGELFHGKKLIPNPDAPPDAPPDQRFIYNGAAITIDPAQVVPMRDSPHAADFAAGTPERDAIDAFNRAYTRMLKGLHQAFAAGSQDDLDAAVDMMRELGGLAGALTQITLGDGTVLGPTFEYLA